MGKMPRQAYTPPDPLVCPAFYSSDVSVRGQFVISSRKYRVAAPPGRPLPLECTFNDVAKSIRQDALGRNLEVDALRMLEFYGINWDDAYVPETFGPTLLTRAVPGEEWTGQPTLYIIAPWTDDSPKQWKKVVSTIKKHVDSLTNNPTWAHVEITVEMVGLELVMPKYTAPVMGNQSLERDWPAISQTVLSAMDSCVHTKSCTTSISLFHLGYDEVAHLNPVTVYISVDYSCPEDAWPLVLDTIQEGLNKTPHNLTAYIEHNEFEHLAFQLLSPTHNEVASAPGRLEQLKRPYDDVAHLGANIGSSLHLQRDDGKLCSPSYGTLGCYVDILRDGNSAWEKFALTNYHVIRPAFQGFPLKAVPKETQAAPQEQSTTASTQTTLQSIPDAPQPDSNLCKYDRKGFGPKTASPLMESPSRYRHNCAIEDARGLIAIKVATILDQEILEQKLSFFDRGRHNLGVGWAGSGLAARTPDGPEGVRRLDWALIDVVANRRGTNRLPAGEAWVSTGTPVELIPAHKTVMALHAIRPIAGLNRVRHVHRVMNLYVLDRGGHHNMTSSLQRAR